VLKLLVERKPVSLAEPPMLHGLDSFHGTYSQLLEDEYIIIEICCQGAFAEKTMLLSS
jgi:hypothetical protein